MQLKSYLLFALFFSVGTTTMADPGNGIVADSKGNIFYTDLAQVWKLDAQGNKTMAVPNVHTHELYMDKNDNLFGEHLWYNGEALNTWGHYAWKLDAAGKLEKVIKDTAGFLEWYSFVRDDAGNMYYLEKSIPSNIWKITPSGQRILLASASYRNMGRLLFHKGVLFFYNHDDMYTIREGDSIQLFRSNLYEGKDSCDRCMESVFTDAEDNIYAAVSAGKIIKKIAAGGTVSIVHRSLSGWFPTGGVVVNGKLWVLEYNSKNEIRVIAASVNGTQPDKREMKAANASFKWLLLAGVVLLALLFAWFYKK